MDDLEKLVTELIEEAQAKNRRAADRLYEAVAHIARVGSGEAQREAASALRFRNGQHPMTAN